MSSYLQIKKEDVDVEDVKILHIENVTKPEQVNKMKSDDRPFKCKLCPKTYTQTQNLRDHMYSHEAERKFKCNQCEKSYIYSQNYKRHMRTHEGFKCDFCPQMFKWHVELKQHKSTHEKAKCSLCETLFSSRGALSRHMHTIHKRFKCYLCRQSYSSEVSLRKHVESHKDNPPVTCEMCDQQFWSTTLYKRHKETIHEKRFSCEICMKQFPRKASLKTHKKVIHADVAAFKCEECDFSTRNSKEFDSHKSKHSEGIMKLGCDRCEFTTFRPKNLKIHKRRLHENSLLWHRCSLCDCKFRKDGVLRAHVLKWHGGIKDFKCEECGLAFMTRLLLDVHTRTHAVTKHQCGRCLSYYKRAYTLKKHVAVCMKDKAEIDDGPIEPDPLATEYGGELIQEIDEVDNFLVVVKDERNALDGIKEEETR